ncbi:Uncharacterized protein GBIM_07146 [Gryllus bimaculatus]|nr:Uncharacterized protein GBIM_07146 [Gryllus bimaculatus]
MVSWEASHSIDTTAQMFSNGSAVEEGASGRRPSNSTLLVTPPVSRGVLQRLGRPYSISQTRDIIFRVSAAPLTSLCACVAGRRMFGGYRIVPRACKPTAEAGGREGKDGATGVCMFNYECTRRGGEVVGACMDGFLFGACCKLPPGVDIGAMPLPAEPPTLPPPPPPPAPAAAATRPADPVPPLTVDHPEADTVLMHHNGSEVLDNELSEELFKPSTLQRPTYTEPETEILYPVATHTTLEPKHTTFSLVTNVHEYTNERVTNGRPMSTVGTSGTTYQTSRPPSASYITRPISGSSPRPHTSTTHFFHSTPSKPSDYYSHQTSPRPLSSDSYFTVARPSISDIYADTPSATTRPSAGLTPTQSSQGKPNDGDEIVTENVESINHILWILNDTEPFADPEPMPGPEPIPDPEPEAVAQGGLSTWGSVNGLETSSLRPTSYRPVGTPTKTTPSVLVTSAGRPVSSVTENYHKPSHSSSSNGAVSETFRPSIAQTLQHQTSSFYHTSPRPSKPPAPTVIVLSPLSSDFTTTSRPTSKLPTSPARPTTQRPPNRPSSRPTRPTLRPTTRPTYSSPRPDFSTTEDNEETNWTKHPLITVSRPSTNGVRPPSSDYHHHFTSTLGSDSYPHTRPVNVDTTSYAPSTTVTFRPSLGSGVSFSTSRPGDKYTPTFSPGLITTLITKRPPLPVTAIPSVTTPTPSQTPTILYTSSTAIRPSLGSMRPSSQTTLYAHSTTPGGPTIITKFPTTEERPATSVDDLANFPPVRNPQLNTSFSQHERPPLLTLTERPVQVTEAALVPEDELLENEITTPEFVEDDKLNTKIQLFVDKIVESLQDNFQDLEDVLYKRKNATTVQPSSVSL